MLQFNPFKVSLLSVLLISLISPQVSAIFYIVAQYSQDEYMCGIDYEECCENEETVYELRSNNPGLPSQNSQCGELGKYEGTNPTSNIGTCTYGDYKGLGNTWAFCPTSYGGNLYLNGLHKVCNTVTNYQAYVCIQYPTCANSGEVVIACYDDTWYSG